MHRGRRGHTGDAAMVMGDDIDGIQHEAEALGYVVQLGDGSVALTYRGALSTNVPSDAYFSQLNQNITDLTTAIRTFKEAQ